MAGLVLEICAARELKVGPPDAAARVDFHLEGSPGYRPCRGRRPLRGAADALFRLHFPERPTNPLGDHSETPGTGGSRGFRHRALQSQEQETHWQLGAVQELLLRHKPPETPVGIVSRAMRQDQTVTITIL